MKTYQLILATALVALSACTKEEVVNNDVNLDSNEIGFTAVTKKATKANNAIVSGTTYGTDNTFKVWGWQSQASDFSEFNDDAPSNFMTGLVISHCTGSDSSRGLAWRNADHYYYWPFTGAISFLAIHPSTVTPSTPGWDATNDKPQVGISNYQITSSNKTTDLMFANNKGSRTTVATVGDGKMDMVFHHALSQIEVRVKTDANYSADVQFDVTSVRFNNIYLSGDVQYSNDVISWSPVANTTQTSNWDYYTTAKENIINYDLSTDAGKEAALYGAANLMIPQAANIKAGELESTDPNYVEGDFTETTITIGYAMQQLPKANNAKIEGTVTISKPQLWEVGKKYNYVINFKLNEILFDPSVIDWVDVDVTAINIFD